VARVTLKDLCRKCPLSRAHRGDKHGSGGWLAMKADTSWPGFSNRIVHDADSEHGRSRNKSKDLGSGLCNSTERPRMAAWPQLIPQMAACNIY
jgi:hypothetical protein